jgi:hypothetical protein
VCINGAKAEGFDASDRSSTVRDNIKLDVEILGLGIKEGRGRWYWASRPLPYLFIQMEKEGE